MYIIISLKSSLNHNIFVVNSLKNKQMSTNKSKIVYIPSEKLKYLKKIMFKNIE